MDLLDFGGDALYFDHPLQPETARLLQEAAELYGEIAAEARLLRAYFLEPEHLTVLVALYRFFYYQHRYHDALLTADRALAVAGRSLGLDTPWSGLTQADLAHAVHVSMSLTRFYLLALKGAGYLHLRLGGHREALARLGKVAELDVADRLGAGPLIELARRALAGPEGAGPDEEAQAALAADPLP